ncbi:MAG: magnesium transporter [Cyanobacteriota bacterium]
MSKIVPEVQNIKDLLQCEDDSALRQELNELHPADLYEVFLEISPEERSRCFMLLDTDTAGDLLDELDVTLQTELFSQLSLDTVLEIFELMPNDAVVDLLGVIPPAKAEYIIKKLPAKESEEIRELMQYPEDTAGGIMTSEYLKLISDMTVGQTIQFLRMRAELENTSFYYLYVVDRSEVLVGVVGLRALITSPDYITIEEIMDRDVTTVNVYDDQEVVADTLQKYNFLMLPVVDDSKVLKGIVTWDDAQDVIEEEVTEDIYSSGGIQIHDDIDVEEIIKGKLSTEVKARVFWLMLTMFAGFGAVTIGKTFEETLEALPIIAIFLPLVIGLGGNTGTQSVTIIVRALYTGDIALSDAFKYIIREFNAGLIIGLLFGCIVTLASFLFTDNPMIAIIVGISMVLTICFGATVGTIVPFVLKKMNFDPAVASGPIITTGIDVVGIAIYFGLVTLMLTHFPLS